MGKGKGAPRVPTCPALARAPVPRARARTALWLTVACACVAGQSIPSFDLATSLTKKECVRSPRARPSLCERLYPPLPSQRGHQGPRVAHTR